MRFYGRSRKKLVLSLKSLLVVIAILTIIGLTVLTLRQIEPSAGDTFPIKLEEELVEDSSPIRSDYPSRDLNSSSRNSDLNSASCATVEEMGEVFDGDGAWKESLRVRKLIQNHFENNGASRVRSLPPYLFCRHGFVLGKASEAGFGNEMYKILTAAALSIMLNRSLIIGQTRGKYPFGDYISYMDRAFTLKEVKHLWRQNGCVSKYGRNLVVRIDDFQKPSYTNILCSNWKEWEQPVIWIQNTTDAVASQFFLKNVHAEMRNAASELFGKPELLQSRPNVFGELMRVLISPSQSIEEAVQSVLADGVDPDISLHMRMLMNRSVRAAKAALSCIRKAMQNRQQLLRPKVVLVSDTPSFIKTIKPSISDFAEVVHFDYEVFRGKISSEIRESKNIGFRVKDWGPAPRWVAFVDFFLASRAKHAVVSGAHRRVGTTYAQLIAALAAAHNLVENSSAISKFSFFSSFQNNLLRDGLSNQIGWGHAWNRFAGPLSCRGQATQCALTPLLPPAWWDGLWQSPIPRDIRRLEAYGVRLSGFGSIDEHHLLSFCTSRKATVTKVSISAV
ncbi:hypothetical protein Nepgr_016891 [Nepenthes gracilis]|uniref:Uncharacterized protein n=1 Tax=Nepenthes gracilis TaxID=150966 RepID=A0AAD3SNF2_NEPGR|nr:hypothetical protein Nepgr_016891 [Nepenthes gracilis]